MRILKLLLAIAVTCSLINPMNVCAEEHVHNLVMTGEETNSGTTDECCMETVITITYTCDCGYELEDKITEKIFHDWEVVCVDPVNNGYQQVCSKCGRTKGNIAYPACVEEDD